MILLNPQWQGGGEPSPYFGAKEIEKLYLKDQKPYQMVDIYADEMSKKENGIIGYETIIKQTRCAGRLLEQYNPEKLFTIGGSCDADLMSLAYLNNKYHGDLTVFWLDAHGDLNSPEESGSSLFYGMPARMLIQPEYEFKNLISRPIETKQLIQVGGRDFDSAEKEFISKNNITYVPTNEAIESIAWIRKILSEKGNTNVYIHLDLDVLEPLEFSATPLPAENGISIQYTLQILDLISNSASLVGFGLYEYINTGKRHKLIDSIFHIARSLID